MRVKSPFSQSALFGFIGLSPIQFCHVRDRTLARAYSGTAARRKEKQALNGVLAKRTVHLAQ
jgi:hypothetical protein